MILKADPEFKRKILKIQGITILGVGALIYWGLPAFQEFIKAKKPEEGIHILLWMLALLFAHFIFVAMYIVFKGRKVLKAGQFPLPGTKVVRDTPILHGRKVVLRAKLMIGSGIVIAILSFCGAIYFPWALHKEVHRSLSKSNNGRQQGRVVGDAVKLGNQSEKK